MLHGSIRALPSIMRAIRTPLCLALVFAGAASIETLHAQALHSRVYASGLSSPVAFVQDPTNSTVQFVVEQAGRIRVVQSGVVQPTDFLDLRTQISAGGERGLLGMAF